MHVLPAPPYPQAPPPTGITATRAWFLYGVAGFTKAQIGELTGATRAEVERSVLFSRCTRDDKLRDVSASVDTVGKVTRRLGLTLSREVARARLRRLLRDEFVSGAVPWEDVDALPIAEIIPGAPIARWVSQRVGPAPYS